MAGRNDPSRTMVDPDDWFAGSDVDSFDETQTVEQARAREPDWVDDAVEEDAPAVRGGRVSPRGVVVLVVSAIVLIFAVLAASGVFSGGGSPSSSPPTTTGSTTTPTHPATTPTTPPAQTPSVTLPTTVLKPGATGAEVKQLQQALVKAGQSPGAVDGVYGPKTEAAVKAFQTSAGITADGVYGPETKKALEQNLKAG
jgi:hypothetical protein